MNYTYEEIKSKVFVWFHTTVAGGTHNFTGEIIKNEKSILMIDFKFTNCTARLTVYNPYLLPLKYVDFEIWSTKENRTIHVYHDSQTTRLADVVEQLNKSIEIGSNH